MKSTTTPMIAAPDVVSTWRALGLLARVVKCAPERQEKNGDGLAAVLGALVKDLGKQFDADCGTIVLGDTAVRWTRHRGLAFGKPGYLSAEEIAASKRLHMPALCESDVVGALEFTTSGERAAFRTVHLKLLRIIAAYLSLFLNRATLSQAVRFLEGQKGDLADATIGHHRRHSMLYHLWRLMQTEEANPRRRLNMSLGTICHGIPCSAGLIEVIGVNGKVVGEVTNGLDVGVLRRLKEILRETREHVVSDGFCSRTFRRVSEAKKVKPLRYAVMTRLRTKSGVQGVIALARGRGEPEFTTVERQVLEICSALVPGEDGRWLCCERFPAGGTSESLHEHS